MPSFTYIRTENDFETELSNIHLDKIKVPDVTVFPLHNELEHKQARVSVVSLDSSASEPESVTPEPRRALRILMLHGYTQSGDFFRAKTRKLRDHIIKRVEEDMWQHDHEGVEFLYPDAPHHLDAAGVPGHEGNSTKGEEMYGWFNVNDQPFRGLHESLTWLVDYVKDIGHIDGVIGFSQGGALGMMLAALCEGKSNPDRLEALANQGFPIHLDPPQDELNFAVTFCGFRGKREIYNGFYDPMIITPTMYIEAELDIMVSKDVSAELIDACADVEVLRHRGGHYVPTDKHTMDSVASFVQRRISEDSDWE